MRPRTRLILLCAIALWLVVMGLPPTLVLTPDEEAQYEVLVDAKSFAGPVVGLGVESREAVAMRYFAAHPHGDTVFRHLIVRGEQAGKLYGLIGLRRTSPRLFKLVVQPFRVSPGKVVMIFGCVPEVEPVRHVVASNEPGTVRLRRGETLLQWHRAHPNAVNIDILGGGYTSMFLDWKELSRPYAL